MTQNCLIVVTVQKAVSPILNVVLQLAFFFFHAIRFSMSVSLEYREKEVSYK